MGKSWRKASAKRIIARGTKVIPVGLSAMPLSRGAGRNPRYGRLVFTLGGNRDGNGQLPSEHYLATPASADCQTDREARGSARTATMHKGCGNRAPHISMSDDGTQLRKRHRSRFSDLPADRTSQRALHCPACHRPHELKVAKWPSRILWDVAKRCRSRSQLAAPVTARTINGRLPSRAPPRPVET